MRVVLQRVSEAKVVVANDNIGSIGNGVLILVGFTQDDNKSDLEWMCRKVVQLRIFDDAEGKMNLSLLDVAGDILVVSQFTLFASTKKGNRPSYTRAARPKQAEELYEEFVKLLRGTVHRVQTGKFGAAMEVTLLNDGPVTIQIDSQRKE